VLLSEGGGSLHGVLVPGTPETGRILLL
jgi:hypothetical protein